jgi:hypothetical protein
VKGLLLILAVFAVAACSEVPTAPARAFEGTFVLRTIGGQPIPILVTSAAPFRVTVVADTLVFDARGHYTRRFVEAIDSLGGSQHIQSTFNSGSYVVAGAGDTTSFPYACPMNIVCAPPAFGVREPEGDLVFVDRASSLREWRYAHVR